MIVAYLLVGASSAWLVASERTSPDPLLPRTLLGNSVFRSASGIGFLLNFGLFGVIFMLGIFFQHAKGATPFQTGVLLLPMTIVFVLGNLAFAPLARKVGSRRTLQVALIVAAVGTGAMTAVSADTPYWLLALVTAAVNFGVGMAVPAMTATLMGAAEPQDSNIAAALLNANRQVGSLLGVAVAGMIFSLDPDWYGAAGATFAVAAVAYAAAAALSLSLVRQRASSVGSIPV
jgi:DHA2 family methylenomycin A resistance protein-like MFS transporter